MSKKILIIIGALIVIASVVLVACKSATPTAVETQAQVVPTPITCVTKIGAPTMITGVGAAQGVDIMAGLKLAVEKINAEGGVLGCQLELVFADIKAGDASDCALAAQVMDQADVVAYFPGAFFGQACVDEFGKRKPVLFHTSAAKDDVDLAIKMGYKNIFQLCEDELIYGPHEYNIIVGKIGDELGYKFPNKKVALLGGDITYDMYIQQGAKKAFEDAGWEVVLDDTYAYGNTEFGSQLAKIRSENPALILGQITSVDSAVAFINQFLTNPTNSLVYIQFSPVSPEFIKNLGEKANGILWQTSVDILPENKASYYPMFEAEFGHTPGMFGVVTWDDVHIWKVAVESCGDVKAWDCIDNYMNNLSDHPYKGLVGTYGMIKDQYKSPSGDEWIPMQFTQIQDQKNVTLYLGLQPVEGAKFQVPPWIK